MQIDQYYFQQLSDGNFQITCRHQDQLVRVIINKQDMINVLDHYRNNYIDTRLHAATLLKIACAHDLNSSKELDAVILKIVSLCPTTNEIAAVQYPEERDRLIYTIETWLSGYNQLFGTHIKWQELTQYFSGLQ